MPYKASAGVTYINGTNYTGNENSQYYVGSSQIVLGKVNYGGTQYAYVGASGTKPEIVSYNVPESYVGANKIIGTLVDRSYSAPSGYTLYGVPTYGDGKAALNTTWATDNSEGASAKFVYANGGSGTHIAYNSR